MLDPRLYENSRLGGISVLMSGPGEFVPLKRTELQGEITGPLAAMRLSQVFGFPEEE